MIDTTKPAILKSIRYAALMLMTGALVGIGMRSVDYIWPAKEIRITKVIKLDQSECAELRQ